jgi:hypothetical protein
MMKKTLKNLIFILIGLMFTRLFFIPDVFSADATYYNTSTNNPGVWRISKIEYDHDNDGVIDDVVNATYNIHGNYLGVALLHFQKFLQYFAFAPFKKL